jgi:uncharacterized Zn-binding protein involved in type VI secretion
VLPVARVTDPHVCPQSTGPLPHAGGPILPPCQANVLIGGMPAARLSDFAICAGPIDVIFTASSSVLVGQLPLSRMTDQTAHTGMIVLGFPTVLIGGPTFALPPNITISGTPDFQNKVIRDMYFLSTLPSGQQLIERLGRSGQPVTISEFPGNNNSSATPINQTDATDGTGTGSTVLYSPGIQMDVFDAAGHRIAFPPQMALGHELGHALHNAEGNNNFTGTDPAPPASERTISEGEAMAIGTGSHSADSPTENTMRSDAGLPRRDNHFGATPTGPVPNLRPGGP